MTKLMVDAQYKQVKKSYRLTLIKMNQYCGLLRSKWTCIEVIVDQYLRSGVALKLLYALWFTYSLVSWPLFLYEILFRWRSLVVIERCLKIYGYLTLYWFLPQHGSAISVVWLSYLLVQCSHTPLLYSPLLLVGALIYFLSGKWHIMMLERGDDRRTMQASEKELATTKERRQQNKCNRQLRQ